VPEVSKSLEQPLPPLLADAIAKAKAGLISPEQFLDLFEEHGVGGIRKLIYAHRAFNLGFEELKRIEVERGRGLTDQACEDIIDSLDHLQS
jgi:hypothetical protein